MVKSLKLIVTVCSMAMISLGAPAPGRPWVCPDWVCNVNMSEGSIHVPQPEPDGDLESAVAPLKERAKQAAMAGDGAAKAESLFSLGMTHHAFLSIDWDSMLAAFAEAAQLWTSVGDRKHEAIALTEAAWICFAKGERAVQVSRLLAKALAMARAAGDLEQVSRVLAFMAFNEVSLGHQREHRSLLLDSLKTLDANSVDTINSWIRRGDLLTDLNRLEEAEAAYTRALHMARAAGDRQSELGSLSRFVTLRGKVGRPDEAITLLEESLVIADEIHAANSRAGSRIILAVMLESRGRPMEAAEKYREAAEIAHNVLHQPGVEGSCYKGLADALRSIGDLEGAADAYSRWTANLRDMYGYTGSRRSRQLEASLPDNAERIGVLFALHLKHPKAGWDVAAFRALEEGRVEAAAFHPFTDWSDIDRERRIDDLRVQLNKAEARLSKYLAGNGAIGEIRRAEDEVGLIRAQLDDLRAQSTREHPPAPQQVASLEEIRRDVLDDNTVLLEYITGREASYLFFVSRTDFRLIQLPPDAKIEKLGKEYYRESMSTAQSAATPASRELGRLLLAPVAEVLGDSKLLIVCKGILSYVPFAALVEPAHGEPLIATHEIVFAPSASFVAAARARSLRPRAYNSIALFADPVFETDDPRLGSHSRHTVGNVSRSPYLSRALRSVGFENGRIPRLVFTKREADAIRALAAQNRVAITSAFGFEASRNRALNQAVTNASIVHFATHAVINNATPELSGLILSLEDATGRFQNGFIRVPDIYEHQFNADLIVLSACQTAKAPEARFTAISIAGAFLESGAGAVAASLWKIDDAATAALMSEFYRDLLGNHHTPAAALRFAQMRLATNPRWRAPRFWAGFELIGNAFTQQ